AACAGRLYELDLPDRLPTLLKTSQQPGRKLSQIISDVLHEYLNEDQERYVRLESGRYFLYLGQDRKLGAFKAGAISQEIARRVDLLRPQSKDVIAEAADH